MGIKQRRYLVSGTSELGDLHTFETDDADRASEMRVRMMEDLDFVRCEDRRARPALRAFPWDE